MAIKFLSPVYRIETEMPSLKCNTWASNAFAGGVRKLMIYKGVFRDRWNPCHRFPCRPTKWRHLKTLVPVQSGVHASLSDGSQTILGTKLEHGAWECYMWITWGSPGSPDR